MSYFPVLTTVHRQSGCDAAEQPSGDSGCDEKDTSEWNLNQTAIEIFQFLRLRLSDNKHIW